MERKDRGRAQESGGEEEEESERVETGGRSTRGNDSILNPGLHRDSKHMAESTGGGTFKV